MGAPDIPLRPPEEVMRLARMGAFHQSRLSFMRQLLRRLKAERWRFEVPVFEIDAKGEGHALYCAHGPERSYTLVAFAHDLPPEMRSDRVIATAWDATFTLFNGVPDAADIARLREHVPRQEAGRLTERELSLSRANRSTRVWDYVVERLAGGRQPASARLREVGYLMRTTAVYGSGKFGAADRDTIAHRPELASPFQVEMLSVYLTRAFVADLVEHMARLRAPDTASRLDPVLRRMLGIGNSTGLGMAPFLVNHPALLNAWISAREEALRRVRAAPSATSADVEALRTLVERAQLLVETWRTDHPVQADRLRGLRTDLEAIAARLATEGLAGPCPWNALWLWAEGALSLEGQEMLVSLMIEPHGALVDELGGRMAADEAAQGRVEGAMRLGELRGIVEDVYGWALALDWSAPERSARLWYVSEAKLEPRLGERAEDGLEPYEQPLCPGRDAALLHAALSEAPPEETVAAFLLRHPEHRHIARRAQLAARLPYAEIRDNTIDARMLPIDMLRMKLSFFGACHFDPRSDRWLRINMYQNAPYPAELAHAAADDWMFPPLPETLA
ncbi:MAG: hypothetical protein RIG84_18220 [Roseovarius sp.]